MTDTDYRFGPVRVRSVAPGPYATNCYLVEALADAGSASWVIDSGFEPEHLLRLIGDAEATPSALILTHAHIDHIAGVSAVRSRYPSLPIWIHRDEAAWLNDPELNLSVFSGNPTTAPGPNRELDHGEVLTLGTTSWEVRHVPGHSPGSIALVCVEHSVAIVGDAIFNGSVGRTDFPGCSMQVLERSIRTQLYTLSDGVSLFPGHGPPTTVGNERANNPFVPG